MRADTQGRRPGAVRHHAVARGRQALQRHHRARQRRDHRQALQGRPAELRRVRRQARLRARARCRVRWCSTACASACRSARTCGRPTSSNASPRPAARSCWCPTARPTRSARPTCGCSTASSAWSRAACRFAYINQVGGQDEVVYDGGSFVLGADRQLKAKLASFREQVATVEFRRDRQRLGMPARPDRARARANRIDLPGDDAGPARLREQDRLSLGRSSACRAASIRRSPPRSPPMRWARSACTRS